LRSLRIGPALARSGLGLLLCALVGCGDNQLQQPDAANRSDLSWQRDLSVSPGDLTSSPDLIDWDFPVEMAANDLSLPDLSVPDLETPDLAKYDFATPPDLVVPPDLLNLGADLTYYSPCTAFKPFVEIDVPDKVEVLAVAIADVNGDGHPDVMVGGEAVFVYFGDGKGGLSMPDSYDLGGQAAASGMSVGDLNHDGLPDLVVTSYGPGFWVLLNKGLGKFAAPVASAPLPGGYNAFRIAIGDINLDGLLDLAAASGDGGGGPTLLSVWLGKGDGTFPNRLDKFLQITHPGSAKMGDFDHDGWLDLAVSAGGDLVYLHGLGTGKFTDAVQVGFAAVDLAVADLNHDGNLDILAPVGFFTTLGAFLGAGNGTFAETDYPFAFGGYRGFAVGDFNHDGFADAAGIEINAGSHLSYSFNDGHGAFGKPGACDTGDNYLYALATGDLNGDGKDDIVVLGHGLKMLIFFSA
jgi:hypothetical protein